MRSTYSTLMQSKFFNPAFNSAIFDGPIRIYFAQLHESLALKIYFCLQQKFPNEVAKAKELHKTHGHNVLLMLYPTDDSFQMSFEGHKNFLAYENLLEDTVIGVNGPFEDDQLMEVIDAVMSSVRMEAPALRPLEAQM